GVLLARLEGKLSQALAADYTARLEALFGSCEGVQFFIDASALESYELCARDYTNEFLVAQRERLGRMVLLNWLGGMSSVGKAVAQELGDKFELAASREEFESKLRAVAPLALAWSPSPPEVRLTLSAARNRSEL